MKKIFTLLIMASISNFCSAQNSLPSKNINKQGSIQIIPQEKVSEAERTHYWKKTTRDADGYMRNESSEDYVTLIPKFTKIPIYEKINPDSYPRIGKFSMNGKANEDENRTSYVLSDGNDQHLMITTWKYKQAGATINIPAEVINSTINGMPAIFSLAVSKDSAKALWKAAFWNSNLFVEVYVEDMVSRAGVPGKSFSSIENIVRDVANHYNN